MGRKKIQISRIGDERNRQVTFTKRKFGLMKKAYELSVLCDCEIALIIFNSANKLFQYASTDMDKVLLKYTEYNEPHESRTNKDIIEALNKKEHKGTDSPDADQEQFVLTPRTEEKYEKINAEFNLMMQRNQLQNRPMSTYAPQGMPVSVPVQQTGFGGHPSSGGNNPTVTLMPPQAMPQGSLSPRPSSAGGMMDLTTPNGYQQASSPSAVHSTSSSPGMITKAMTKQSPPGGGGGQHQPQQQQQQQRPNLRVVIPNSRGEAPVSEENHPRTSNATLATPVVSLATPSIPGHGSSFPSSMPSSFPGEFQLTSTGELQGLTGFNSPALLSGNWGNQVSLSAGVPSLHTPHTSLSSSASTLSISTSHQSNMNIKSEPISPPRDATTPNQLRPPSSGHMSTSGHTSPIQMANHSNSSSPVSGLGQDFDGPIAKRSRLAAADWTAS